MCGSYYAMGMAIKAAFAVPFLTVSAAVFVKQGEWVIWRYILILGAAVALGALLIRGVSGRMKNDAARVCLKLAGWITPAALIAGGLYLMHGVSVAALPPLLVTLLTFIGCMTCARLDYKDMVTPGQLLGFSVLYIGTIAAEALLRRFFSLDLALDRAPMIICMIVCCAFVAVILNQTNLETLASKRRRTSLPLRVRTNNLKLVLVVLGILLVGYIFRQQIVDAAQFVLYVLWRIVFHLVRGFFAVLNFLSSLGSSDEVIPAPEMNASPDEYALPEADDGGDDGVWFAILLLSAIAVFIIVKFGPRLFKKLSAWLRKTFAKLVEWFSRFASRKEQENSELFSDSEEALDEPEEEKLTKRGGRSAKRELKGAFRRYEGSSGAQRVREGYRVMLDSLAYRETPADPADTSWQIPLRIDDGHIAEQFEAAAPIYDAVRYGGKDERSEDAETFDSAVKTVFSAALSRKR